MGSGILPLLLLQGHRVLVVMLRYYLDLVARLCLQGLDLEADFPSDWFAEKSGQNFEDQGAKERQVPPYDHV